ncbi:hypothetical protein CCP3SC5AM1_1360008 [Gammaproteobacteria bacterium]
MTFPNMRLSHRFGLLVILVTISFAMYGFWSFNTLNNLKLNGPLYHRIIQSKNLIADILPPSQYIIESYLIALQIKDASPQEQVALTNRMKALKQEYDTRHEFWKQTELNQELQKIFLLDAHQPVGDFYKIAFEKYIPELNRGDMVAARDSLKNMESLYATHRDRIEKVVTAANQLSMVDESKSREMMNNSLLNMLLILIASMAVVLWMVYLLFQAIIRPLTQARAIASKIAVGDMSSVIIIEHQDEIGEMLGEFAIMRDALNRFVSAQAMMLKKHNEGWISERIDASKFSGVYGKIANDLNELISSHVEITKNIVTIIAQYAKGDFSHDLQTLPGEQEKITTALADVKKSLVAISDEIKNLVMAGANGDFSKRGGVENFDFMFRDMLHDLNKLTETCEIGFNDVTRVAEALARADLTQTISNDHPGMFGEAKDAIRAC